MPQHRGFRIGFATGVFFTVLAGDAWRYSISWYGWGVVALTVTAVSVLFLVRYRGWRKHLPVGLVAFLLLATASIAWSYYPGASVLGVAAQWVTTTVGVGLAVALRWDELIVALGWALRIVLGLSILFELFVALIIRQPVLPFWVDYGTRSKLPKLLYWSRDVLFSDGKIQGIVGNSSLLAMVGLLGLIVFAVQLAAGTVSRVDGIVWILLASGVIALTRSPTIFVGLAVCTALLVAILALRRARTRRSRAIVYSAMGTTVVLAIIAVALFGRQLLALVGKSETLTGRAGIWDAVIGLAQQRPGFGWGWVSYWVPWVAPFDHLVTRAGVLQLHAHNAWLDVWLQLGVAGLLVFGFFVLVTSLRAWFVAVDRPRPVAVPVGHPQATPLQPTPLAPTQQQPVPAEPGGLPASGGALGRYTVTSLLPILIVGALLVQSLAESRLLIEYGWLLMVVLAVKMKQREAT